MKLTTKLLGKLGRWAAVALLFVSTIAFGWHIPFSSHSAMAAPSALLAAKTDYGSQVQRENKNVVRDAADKVKETANKNANRVERASDNDGSFVERKAQRDAARIEKRANEDASRTEKAIDDSVNVFERAVDNIKDAFSK